MQDWVNMYYGGAMWQLYPTWGYLVAANMLPYAIRYAGRKI